MGSADPLSGSDGCCLAPHLSAGGITHRSGVTRDPPSNAPRILLPAQCHPCGDARSGSYGGPCRCAPGAPPGWVTEARGPFGPRHRRGLWIDGRWPYPKLRFLEGAAPWDPPFAGVVLGVGPPNEARMPQAVAPPRGSAVPASGPGLEGLQ
ncbi:hypothetical protein N7449_012542 [Penicillium cf. viridicatum]|uniref:Uncharacterized protein n=1 Tax=Penicillium cf. viridicatum TaxID=2972119 RepID=A0A9W9ISG9_9EURO|nr:hypothetical protein N7449_012542 [Penicillium cf. viridicatum]